MYENRGSFTELLRAFRGEGTSPWRSVGIVAVQDMVQIFLQCCVGCGQTAVGDSNKQDFDGSIPQHPRNTLYIQLSASKT